MRLKIMIDFIYLCALTGVADFMYYKSNRNPKWMNKREAKAWRIGYNYASKQC